MFILLRKIKHTHVKVIITFHINKWENLTATENTNLEEFVVNIIKVIAINVNPIVTKVILNSLIIIINISFCRLHKETILKRSYSVSFTTL